MGQPGLVRRNPGPPDRVALVGGPPSPDGPSPIGTSRARAGRRLYLGTVRQIMLISAGPHRSIEPNRARPGLEPPGPAVAGVGNGPHTREAHVP
jgi:hypothetical protein